ncbi:hypothetical protein QUB60_00680 [Microcoleus sp. A2-C5]|uniref:hypothetical protein n=1 Tax=unclassified Microcoleus TaxID=2642155 RepID=UPI002FCF781F
MNRVFVACNVNIVKMSSAQLKETFARSLNDARSTKSNHSNCQVQLLIRQQTILKFVVTATANSPTSKLPPI